jgi:nitrate reductase gamma subunit
MLGKILIVAAYAVYVAFWLRVFMHFLVWWRAGRRFAGPRASRGWTSAKAYAFTVLDIVFFGRLFKGGAALWFGEWIFHFSFLLVMLRHLRFFLTPVPDWVWWAQTPGLIAGYLLPLSLAYILVVRLLTKLEKYASPPNLLLLGLVLVISSTGVLMHGWFKPDIVGAKLFVFGILSMKQAALPESLLFVTHFVLVLVLIPFLPTHIFTAPLVMLEARKREQARRMVMHDD